MTNLDKKLQIREEITISEKEIKIEMGLQI